MSADTFGSTRVHLNSSDTPLSVMTDTAEFNALLSQMTAAEQEYVAALIDDYHRKSMNDNG